MYEQQIISHILNTKSTNILKENNLKLKHFVVERDTIQFIEEYEAKYEDIPTLDTILQNFPEFQYTEAADSEEFIAEQIKENYLYTRLVPTLQIASSKTKENSIEGIEYLKKEIEELSIEMLDNTVIGVDLATDAGERYKDYLRRKQGGGLLGIPSGIKQLDDILYGWAEEDLVTIVARPGQGKSWILQYFAVQAWKQGKRVLYYSGEMSKEIIGYRFDTLNAHFSNSSLMTGEIGEEEKELEYMEYIDSLVNKNGFITITPEELQGKRPTTQDIIKLSEIYKPDIIVIDYIALMEDWNNARDKKDRLGNISKDLQQYSATTGIPIITASQANREAAKKNEDKENPEAPEGHEVSDSDQVFQNSTRVIGLARVDNILKLAIRKNRYGVSEGEILMHWDIDKGIIKPLLDDEKIMNNEYGF